MLEFLTAFNVGDQIRLRRVFAEPGQFKWYSVGSKETGENFVAYDIANLLRYFGQRHSAGEHLALMEFRFRSRGSTGHFQYRLLRWANDIRNATPFAYDGKGALRCTARGGRIIVWSMGSG
jgi:hypothetical protein